MPSARPEWKPGLSEIGLRVAGSTSALTPPLEPRRVRHRSPHLLPATPKLTGRKVYFTILAGTEGSLRGIPVQIRYQPNWWFQVVLNLVPGNPVITAPTLASVDSSRP